MEHKQNINVTLKVKEIIFDIMNKTHLTGQAREAEGKKNYEAASYMQASEDDEASYQIRRSVSNAFSAIKVRLGEYLDEDKTTTDNRIMQAVDNIDLNESECVTKIKAGINAILDTQDQGLAELKNALGNANSSLETVLGIVESETHLVSKTANQEQVRRVVNDAMAELVLAFKMPSNFHNAAIDSLGNGCHQYITYKAISDWFVITNPEEASAYNALAEEAIDTTKRALYKRSRPTRPTYE